MSNNTLYTFHITENLYILETSTPKIRLKSGEIYNGYKFNDFFTTFKRELPSIQISANEFLQILQSLKRFVITTGNNLDDTIISIKESYNEKIVNGIKDQRCDPYDEPEEDSEDGEVKVFTKKAYLKDKRGKERNIHNKIKVNNAHNDYNNNAMDINNEGHNIHAHNRSNNKNNNSCNAFGKRSYENKSNIKSLDKQSSEGKLPENTMSSKRQRLSNYTSQKNTYEENKKLILMAIEAGSVFAVTSFQPIMTARHGNSFEYKTAIARTPKSLRGKLSMYLDDCDDFLEKISISGQLYYMKKGCYGDILINKRKHAHMTNLNIKTLESRLHIEMMIINMFPIKTTLFLNDVEVIFEKVYGVSLSGLVHEKAFQYIRKMKSPNMTLKGTKDNVKITLIPCTDVDFKEYDDYQVQLLSIENKIVSTNNSMEAFKDPQIETFRFEIPVKYESLISTKDLDVLSWMRKADLNLPRSVQKKENFINERGVMEKFMGRKFGFSKMYFLLQANIAFKDIALVEYS